MPPPATPLQRLLHDLGVPDADIAEAEAAGPAAVAALAANRAAFPGDRRYTPRDVWEQAGVGEDQARALWRAMGFPDLDDDERVLTDADLSALRTVAALAGSGFVEDTTIVQLARVMSQAMATIAAAHIEAATVDASPGTDEEEAFAGTLQLVGGVLPAIDELLVYLYRRHLANVNERAVWRLTGMPEGTVSLAVGFSDLVDFTATARSVDDDELATLVETFAALAGGCVAERGGRVVKMIGDEVMFSADDAAAAALIALDLTEQVDRAGIGAVRTGVAHGPVIPMQGDLFGRTVNLAARLVTAARPGTVLVDDDLSSRLDDDERFFTKPVHDRKLKGIGRVSPLVLRRARESRGAAETR